MPHAKPEGEKPRRLGPTPRLEKEPGLIDAICEAVALNMPIRVAVETLGVHPSTMSDWMLKGKRRSAEGKKHGTRDACEECPPGGVELCPDYSVFVELYQRVQEARAQACGELMGKIQDKAADEKGGSRVLLELARSLYPDQIHNPKDIRGKFRWREPELMGEDPKDHKSDESELALELTSAQIAKTEAQTELAKAQKENIGQAGSYFDKLLVKVADAIAGAGQISKEELADASPSVALDEP